jgi:hypothetical protein
MQVAQSSLAPLTRTDSADSINAAQRSAAAARAGDASSATPTPARAELLRRGLTNWDLSVQGEVAGAQQALDFLERSAGELSSLQGELAARLANRTRSDGQAGAQVSAFARTWSTRAEASGGTLDNQLEFNASAGAARRFRVPGLALDRLRSGGKETLVISVGGSRQPASVTIEPGLSDAELARRFDHALAPLGMRAGVEDSALVFRTAEANYANVAATLSIKGGGQRFPTGQLHRAVPQAQPDAIDPSAWRSNDADGLRQTLQEVTRALSRVLRARGAVQQALSDASNRVAAAQPDSGQVDMERVVQNFATVAAAPDYESLIVLNAALYSISRDRVLALLGLQA